MDPRRCHMIVFSSLVMMFLSLGTMTLSYAGGDAMVSARKELRVMILNVWSGLDYKGTLRMGEYETVEVRETRFQALVEEIRTLSPDIIGLNEANFLPDYVERLAEILGYDYIYHVGVSGLHVWRIGIPWNLKEGDAILARKDLGLKYAGRKQLSGGGFVWNNLSFHTQDATQLLVGKVTLGGREIYIAVTHWHSSPANNNHNKQLLDELKEKFGYSEKEYQRACSKLEHDNTWRMNEAKAMVSYLKETIPEDAPLVVMGDFNAEIESAEMRYFLSAGFYDTYSLFLEDEGYTWNADENENIKKFYRVDLEKPFEDLYEHLKSYSRSESRRIDFILVNDRIPEASIIESKVCGRILRRGVHPSDHYGVFAVIRNLQLVLFDDKRGG